MARPSSSLSLRLTVVLAFAFAVRTTSTLSTIDHEAGIGGSAGVRSGVGTGSAGSTGAGSAGAGGAFGGASSVRARPRPTFLIIQWGTPDYLGRYAEFIERNREYARRYGYGYHLSTVSYEAQLGTLSKVCA